MAAEPIDFGAISQGEFRTLTFTFKTNGTPTDPAAGAYVNMTAQDGQKTSYTTQLVHQAGGVYSLGFSADVPGFWTGTAYAPPGSGQASQRFKFEVIADANYG